MWWCTLKSRSLLFILLFCVGTSTLLISDSVFAARRSTKKSQSDFWIVGRNHPEHKQFGAKKLEIDKSIYLLHSHLVLGKSSVDGWAHRISHPFEVTSGNHVVLHFRTRYFDKWSTIWPGYTMQMNLEIPQHLFKNQKKISLKDIRGYLTWSHPDYSKKTLYLQPKDGHIEIWKVKRGLIKGWLNLKFYDHDNVHEEIHIYGHIRSYFKSRRAYQSEQDNMKNQIYREANTFDYDF